MFAMFGVPLKPIKQVNPSSRNVTTCVYKLCPSIDTQYITPWCTDIVHVVMTWQGGGVIYDKASVLFSIDSALKQLHNYTFANMHETHNVTPMHVLCDTFKLRGCFKSEIEL